MAATQVSPTAARSFPEIGSQDFSFEMWFVPAEGSANDPEAPLPGSLVASTLKVGTRSIHHLTQGQLHLINSSSQVK